MTVNLNLDLAKLKRQLVFHEGTVLFPYVDKVGKLTIGVGRNLDANGISKDEAMYLLENDIDDRLIFLSSLEWFRILDEVRQRVIVDMSFQMGKEGLLGFHTTIARIKGGDYAGAANSMLQSKWATQTPERAARLAGMMATGTDSLDFDR